MPFPVLSVILIIFVLWLHYEINKSKKLLNKDTDAFWLKEKDANLTRRADISNLEYITIPLELLPMEDREDDTLNSYRDTIRDLSDKKIVNLTGQTNTELKRRFGVANLQLLSEYDNNYLILVSILQKWGERLYNQGFKSEAAIVLEFAVNCSTDAINTYKLLAKIYCEQDTPNKIDNLISTLSKSDSDRTTALINEIRKMLC